jgi:hypothetical protein
MSKASDLESLAKSYLDLWQDQFTAMAADPANAEAMARLFGAMAAGPPGGVGPAAARRPAEAPNEQSGSEPGGTAGAAPGPAPAGAASGDRDDRLSELAERIGELDERLARLERKLERKSGGAKGKPKKRKS